MSACCCTGPTTGDHLCPCRRRDEDARQAAKAQGVFSQWNACCYRDKCRQRATDYASLQTAFDRCHAESVERWRALIDAGRALEALQAKLDAVTKDSERLDFLIEWFGWNDDLEGSGIRDWIDYADARAAIDAALPDQGRAGEGRNG